MSLDVYAQNVEEETRSMEGLAPGTLSWAQRNGPDMTARAIALLWPDRKAQPSLILVVYVSASQVDERRLRSYLVEDLGLIY